MEKCPIWNDIFLGRMLGQRRDRSQQNANIIILNKSSPFEMSLMEIEDKLAFV